jgi:flagellar biogenesis protein FliO
LLTPTPGYLSGSLKNIEAQPGAFEAPSLLPLLFNLVLSLAFVLLLIYLAYWLLRRWRAGQGVADPGKEEGLIHVLEKNYVDNKHGLAVVEMGGEVYFIGLGLGGDITLLSRIIDPAAVEKIKAAAPASPGGLLDFREQFEKVGIHLRREQWKKSKQDLKAQSVALDTQIGRLKPAKKKDDA